MASVSRPRYITREEYLARERMASFKSEYVDGNIYPMGDPITGMAGTSLAHNRIAANLGGELHSQLKGGQCEAFMADLRVLADGILTYPDVVAACGELRFPDEHFDTLMNPTLIVEVLSPSTESWDRGGKFAHYKKMDSLREYVLISQDAICVELFTRQGDEWALTTLDALDAVLRLDSIGCAVPLSEIYARVEFPVA